MKGYKVLMYLAVLLLLAGILMMVLSLGIVIFILIQSL